jgi:G3E family GTPase
MTPRASPPRSELPVSVMGGYLGAGKTSLINHLLRNAQGRRLAVLVNDFGDVSIDEDLIEARSENVLSIAGGCVCCTFGSDLMHGLLRLKERLSTLDHVLIETSGVALPASVASTAGLIEGLRVQGVVVLADASTLRQQATDRYVGDTVMRQLQQADLLVLNKIDLVSPRDLQQTRRWLKENRITVRTIEVTYGQFALDALLSHTTVDAIEIGRSRAMKPVTELRLNASARESFRSCSFRTEHHVDVDRLGQVLTQSDPPIVRAKGIVRDRDGAFMQIQLSGGKFSTAPWSGFNRSSSRLVCIGAMAAWDERLITKAIGPFFPAD